MITVICPSALTNTSSNQSCCTGNNGEAGLPEGGPAPLKREILFHDDYVYKGIIYEE